MTRSPILYWGAPGVLTRGDSENGVRDADPCQDCPGQLVRGRGARGWLPSDGLLPRVLEEELLNGVPERGGLNPRAAESLTLLRMLFNCSHQDIAITHDLFVIR